MNEAYCLARIRALYETALPRDAGTLHVVAIWDGDRERCVLKINASTPRSETDFFALNLARARADAIVTTGKILREEPDVTHSLQGSEAVVKGLAQWRSESLGRSFPPLSAVLTSGRGLNWDHPIFHAGTPALVYTSVEAVAQLEGDAQRSGVELVAAKTPSLANLILYLKQRRGAQSVSLEAGPSVVLPLYKVAGAIDELMLSRYEAGSLPEAARGAPFPREAELRDTFAHASAPLRVEEPSGPWSFSRLWV